MTWCHQATSQYLSHCWSRSMSPYSIKKGSCLRGIDSGPKFMMTSQHGKVFHITDSLWEESTIHIYDQSLISKSPNVFKAAKMFSLDTTSWHLCLTWASWGQHGQGSFITLPPLVTLDKLSTALQQTELTGKCCVKHKICTWWKSERYHLIRPYVHV